MNDIKDYASFNLSNDESNIIKYDEATQITDESYTEVNKALSIDENITAEILNQDAFADKYKSRFNTIHILRLIVSASLGISASNTIMIFFDKNKRRKYIINEINKNSDEFEIHKNIYKLASEKHELLKEKKSTGTGYPVYEYESFNEEEAKELVKKNN